MFINFFYISKNMQFFYKNMIFSRNIARRCANELENGSVESVSVLAARVAVNFPVHARTYDIILIGVYILNAL